jgi:hypothetical protein
VIPEVWGLPGCRFRVRCFSVLPALLIAAMAAAPAPTRADPPAETALERLAKAVADQLQAKKPEPPVAVSVEASPAPLANAAASALAAELSRRGLPAVVLSGPQATAEKAARDRDLRTLVRLGVTLENNTLSAKGDALGTWVNFWSGQTATRPAFSAALAAQNPADAQAFALVNGPSVAPGPMKLAVGVLAHLPARPAAIAVGDLDGDRKAEVVVLTDDELWAFSSEGKTLARYDLREIPVSRTPCREPFGALVVAGQRVTWLSSKRAHGETLAFANGAFKVVASADSATIEGYTGHLLPGVNAIASELQYQGKPLDAPAPFQSFSGKGGLIALVLDNGAISLSRGALAATGLKGGGSASVVADLDGDGAVELVTTSKAFFADPDEVRVMSARDAEAAQAKGATVADVPALWQGATPRGRAIVAAAGDLDGDGADEVVLGAWLADETGELQVLRRVP